MYNKNKVLNELIIDIISLINNFTWSDCLYSSSDKKKDNKPKIIILDE